MHITALCWQQNKRVDLYYDSIKEAALKNPGLIEFGVRDLNG